MSDKYGCKPKKHEQGFSLMEMLLVVFIMSIVASVAVPTLSSLDELQLELISRDLQQAIRFAQSESIRTGHTHGIAFENTDTRVRLYRYDTAIDYGVIQPVEKQAYELYFGTDKQPVSISSKSFQFESSGLNSQNTISFSAGSGVPVSSNVGSANLLEYAHIELSYNGNTVTLTVSPISGRVTLQ